MISGTRSRLAVVIVLLVLQSFSFAFEVLHFYTETRWRRVKTYMSLRRWVLPIGIPFLGAVLVGFTFSRLDTRIEAAGTSCTTDLDADIAGQGVRIVAFVQVGVLLVISLLGSFHPHATGAKEVGAGLILTSASLAIALLVRFQRQLLNPADAAVGVMLLDGQSAALAVHLAAKETLTSRSQVGIAVLAQVLDLATITSLVARFDAGSYSPDDCSCFTFFWWAWLRFGRCQSSALSLERVVFWIYIACRWVGVLQVSFHSLWNTWVFDRAEKDTRDTSDPWKKLGGTVKNITCPHFTDRGEARYGEYPATVTFVYVFYSLFALTSLASTELTVRHHGLVPSSGIDSIGQVIPIVVAAATVARALWLFVFMFYHEAPGKRSLVWPFKLGELSSLRPVYNPAEKFRLGVDDLPLGTILKDPHDFTQRYDSRVPIPTGQLYSNKEREYREELHFEEFSLFSLLCRKTTSARTRRMITRVRLMRESWFRPEPAYLGNCTELDAIKSDIGAGTHSVTIYLVVGVRVVRDRPEDIEERLQAAEREEARAEIRTGDELVMRQIMRENERQAEPQPDNRPIIHSYAVQQYTLVRSEQFEGTKESYCGLFECCLRRQSATPYGHQH